MTSNARGGDRILGSLRSADGKGVVRVEDRFDTDIDDVWSALTDPRRLARWIGEVEGDLRLGGEFRARFFASGWEGTGRVEACEPPRRLLLLTQGSRTSRTSRSSRSRWPPTATRPSWSGEERGMPLDQLAAYGAGIQVHVEDLAAHLAGRERGDAEARWDELHACLSRPGGQRRLGTGRCRVTSPRDGGSMPRASLLHLSLHQDQNGQSDGSEPAAELGGRYWDRTSDLLGVN